MKKPLIVYNMKYEKLCDLVNESETSAKRIQEVFKLNEITGLTFEVPLKNPNTSYILNENLILFNGEYYRIKTPTITHNEDGNSTLSVSCSHLSETLKTNVISMEEVTPKNVIQLMKVALAYNNDTPTLGWSVGNVTVDTTKLRGLEKSEQSSFSHLLGIAEKYDGILIFNSQTRTVDLIPREDTAKPDFELSVYKNLKGINITYDTSEMVTRLYCFGGADENGNEYNIMSANPTGKAYVENYQYFLDLGYTQDDISAHPELFIKTNIWRDTNYYLPIDLYNDGIKELEKVCKPKIDVKIEALNLEQFPEYMNVPLSLGEAINVRDEDLGVTFVCNIIGRTINYDEPHILTIEVTNQIEYKNLLSDLFGKVSTASQVVTSGAKVKGSSIDGINTSQIRDLSAKYASITYLEANYIDADSIASQYVTANYLTANYASIENLTTNYLTASQISASYLTATQADLKYATINELVTNYLDANEIDTIYLKAETANLTYVKTSLLEANYITANTIATTYLKASDADLKYATIQTLQANYITASDISTTYLKATDANITFATITNLNSAVANINSLTSEVGDIQTLINGNLTSDNIQSLTLTSLNTTIANAMIKDAMIDTLSVDKLIAGDISTNKFNITSDDGRLVIADNTIQIADGTRVRVQIGKDASNDYNMYVWDTTGKLMFNATGITQDAIQSAIIRDDMVSPTANISAQKINISTLFDVINNDSTHTLNSSKILLDAQGQNLEVAFNSVTSSINNIEAKKMYRLEILSSNGNIFKNSTGSTTLNARVYSWDDDITDTILASNFQWHRKSLSPTDDAYWDSEYGNGKKEIVITPSDVTDNTTSFSFEVLLPD